MKKGWRIRDSNGTYYVMRTGIGPMFGGSRKTAQVFATAFEAVGAMGHRAFAGCRLELPDGKLQSEVSDTARTKAAQRAAANKLASLLRASATAFMSVGVAPDNMTTLYIYWKRSVALKSVKFTAQNGFEDGFEGFRIVHRHFIRKLAPNPDV